VATLVDQTWQTQAMQVKETLLEIAA